jgi:hypothetical protein
MGLTLSYRSSRPVGPEQEAAIRQAADSANRGQAWVRTFVSDQRDGHLVGAMKPHGAPDGGRAGAAARTLPPLRGPAPARCPVCHLPRLRGRLGDHPRLQPAPHRAHTRRRVP